MKKIFIGAILLTITSLVTQPLGSISQLYALSGSEFQAGRIIDDGVFFNSSTMSPDQIQAFLNAKVPVCDTWGTQPYAGTTRAAYSAARGVSTPFICLRDYGELTPAKAAESGLCNYYPGGGLSAAQIVYQIAQSCGINPQVLIVLLQKEQSLITDDWPWPIQYRSATGYGCPDTAVCDSLYYGFFNQVYMAARQFKRYIRDAHLFNYRAGRNNYIQYNPNTACGGSTVFIENNATAALYNYTPYQPNQSSLNNLYGLGDGCGAYGNRNFWRLYRDWFGLTFSNDTVVAHPDGTLVSDGYRIFIIDNGTKRHILGPEIFHINGFTWNQVKPASIGDNNLPEGAPYSYIPPGKPFSSIGTPVYVMDYDQNTLKKRHLSYQAFVELGYKWNEVAYIPPPILPVESHPTMLANGSLHPSGSLIVTPNEGKIYQTENGVRRHILNPWVFASYGFQWSQVKVATQADMQQPEGQSLHYREGTIVHANGVYVIQYDQQTPYAQPFGPWECYVERMRYGSNDWIFVTIDSLPGIGTLFTC